LSTYLTTPPFLSLKKKEAKILAKRRNNLISYTLKKLIPITKMGFDKIAALAERGLKMSPSTPDPLIKRKANSTNPK
jgi:hypothetical protein